MNRRRSLLQHAFLLFAGCFCIVLAVTSVPPILLGGARDAIFGKKTQ